MQIPITKIYGTAALHGCDLHTYCVCNTHSASHSIRSKHTWDLNAVNQL